MTCQLAKTFPATNIIKISVNIHEGRYSQLEGPIKEEISIESHNGMLTCNHRTLFHKLHVYTSTPSFFSHQMSAYNGYTYIVILNLMTTLPAMYGLYLLRNALSPDLEKKFKLTGKIASIQLTMIATALPNLIISILVTAGVISCTPIFPSKARGESQCIRALYIQYSSNIVSDL